jgi:hypothetical protein
MPSAKNKTHFGRVIHRKVEQMNRDRTRRRLGMLFCAFLGLQGSLVSAAENVYLPIAETGMTFHTGTAVKSLGGSTGYFLAFRSEKKKGWFRPAVATQFDYGGGTAKINDEEPPYKLYGANFMLGGNLFIFGSSRFQPFIGLNGILAWQYLKLTTPPEDIEANTQGYGYGYELSAGVDIRFGSKDGKALRLRGGYWYLSSRIAGQTGFILNGFRLGLGMSFK